MDRLVVWYGGLAYGRRVAATAALITPVLAALVGIQYVENGIFRHTLAFGALLYLVGMNALFFLFDARRPRG